MTKLPKKFPEYSILHESLNKKIIELKKKKEKDIDKNLQNEIQTKIENYQTELEKIESFFPKNFFKRKTK